MGFAEDKEGLSSELHSHENVKYTNAGWKDGGLIRVKPGVDNDKQRSGSSVWRNEIIPDLAESSHCLCAQSQAEQMERICVMTKQKIFRWKWYLYTHLKWSHYIANTADPPTNKVLNISDMVSNGYEQSLQETVLTLWKYVKVQT